tara:strand:+ start:18625 stop:21588 length:2964 start_codon:yes stop_codon:yes gene_type:complete
MGTKLDFKVKKGIDVEGGDITVASGNVVYAPTFDTNVAAAGVTLSGTTLQADGTDTNINIAITPKGSGEVDITKVDIDGGTIDGTTIATSDITVGSSKTLDVSAGTLTLADDQISGDKISGGTIGTTTITALAGNLSLGDNNITNVGDINADSISVDASAAGLNVDFSGAASTTAKISLGDNLADALNITEGSNSYIKFITTNSSEQIVFGKNSTFSGTTIANLGTVTTADINGGTIDNTVIGATTQEAASFKTLTVIEGNWARINGTARETNSKLQVNGDALSGASGTTLDYVEARLHTDIANDDINGTVTPYAGLTNTFILDNNENASATHQSVVFSIGDGASNGEHWAIGRKSGGTFSIGYKNTNFDDDPENNAAIFDAQTIFDLDTSGNASLSKDGATLEFNNNSQTTKIKASGSSSASVSYTLPPAGPASNGYVLSSTTGGVMTWIAAAGGADGMGSGFVLEDGDGTEVTIDENKEVKFIDGDGIEINWTDVSTGSDGDPYDLTFSLDIDGMTDIGGGLASGDLFIVDDGAGGTNRKTTVDRIATLLAGAGLTATNAVIAVDADQSSQITAVGTLTGLTVSGATDLNNNLTVDGATISLDATTSLNIDNSNTTNGITIGTATSGVPISIGHTTSEVTINDNLTVTGNLTVDGTTTTVNSTTLQVDDKNIELGTVASPSDSTADGGGITLKGSTDHTITWDNSNDNWTSSEHWNLVTGKVFKINNTSVLSASTLGSGVTTSSLTTVGALNSGSITSGFGTINTGSSAISTTGTLTGGSIVGTSLDVSGNIEGTGTLSLNNGTNTISAAELNVLDGVTAGTVTASKALVVDSNKDIGDLRDLTATGALEADGLQLTGGANSAADSATVVAIMDVSEATGQSWTGSTAYDIANYAFGTYRTAKFIVQVSDGTDTDCMEVLVTYEGASAPAASANIFLTTYAYITTAASDLGTIDAVKGTSTIDLQFTPASTGTYSYSVVNTLLIK